LIAVGDVFADITALGVTLGIVTLMLLLPGMLLLVAIGRLSFDSLIEAICTAVALSLCLVPILFVWCIALALRLSPLLLLAIAVAVVLCFVLLRIRRGTVRVASKPLSRLALISFVLVFGIVLVLRFANIQGIVLPLWVDSVHHSALARLIAEQGMIPNSYRPFADVDAMYYHVGYHSRVVTVAWLSGASIEQELLVLGQVLNALVPVSLYVLAARWTGNAVGGLAAMIVVGTVSLMPAYYVTWGRYTQLEGLVILPIAMLAFEAALSRGENRWLIIAALLGAGLFLIHYRVVVFFATFVVAMLLWQTFVYRRRGQSIRHLWLRAAGVAALALLVSAPWLWRILSTAVFPLDTFTTRFYTTPEGNAVPFDLLSIGTMPALFVLASLSALLALWLSKRSARYVIVVLLWLVLTAVVHNPAWFGLPQLWILENFSAVIALFVPLSLLIGMGVTTLVEFAAERFRLRIVPLERIATLLLLVVALWTAPNMLNIVNPVTVLAEADDLMAMDWIRANTPSSAIFLVNEQVWLSPIYAGTDGGYWIPNLTGRRTTMPIVFYLTGPVAYWHDDVNALASVIASNPDPDDASFLAMLGARGVTHVYFGAKGGPLSLDKFKASAHFREVYARSATHVFTVEY